MVKLLRKYNKYILVVGGSLLMVAFLMPQAIEQLAGNPAKRTYAHMGGRTITYGEIGKAELELHSLERFNRLLTKQILNIENADHWYLLTTAAERGGFTAEGGDDAKDWPLLELIVTRQVAEEMAQRQYGQMAGYVMQQAQLRNEFMEKAREPARALLPELRERALKDSRIDEKDFDLALSKARGTLRMIEAYRGANVLSDRRTLVGGKVRFDAATANAIVIPADRLASKVSEPTEDELKAHFERYRTVKRGEGEFGIGYTLPPRIKLEWLTLDRAAISAAVKIDPVEANKRWRTSRDKYAGEFAVEKARVENDLRAEKVNTIINEADLTIRAELRNPLRRLDADGMYKKLPAEWATQRPSLEKLAQQVAANIRSKHGVEAPLPTVTVKSAAWLTREDLSRLEGIGRSTVRVGPRTLPFADVAFELKELLAAGNDLGLQVGVTSPEVIATTPMGDRMYFTVLDSRKESPADTLEEVKTEAIADYKRLKAYELLNAEAQQLRELAAKESLEAVARLIDEKYPAPAPTPPEPPPAEGAAPATPPAPQPLPVTRNLVFTHDNVGAADANGQFNRTDSPLDTPEARKAIEEVALTLDPTKIADEIPGEQRTLAIPLPRDLSVAVVKLTARVPLTRETVRVGSERTALDIQADELDEVAKADVESYPFSLKKLAARYDFKVEAKSERTKEKEPPAPEAPPPPLGG